MGNLKTIFILTYVRGKKQEPIRECNGKLLLVKGFLKCNILDLKFSSGVHSTREACRKGDD